jgi:hypothetical protein
LVAWYGAADSEAERTLDVSEDAGCRRVSVLVRAIADDAESILGDCLYEEGAAGISVYFVEEPEPLVVSLAPGMP